VARTVCCSLASYFLAVTDSRTRARKATTRKSRAEAEAGRANDTPVRTIPEAGKLDSRSDAIGSPVSSRSNPNRSGVDSSSVMDAAPEDGVGGFGKARSPCALHLALCTLRSSTVWLLVGSSDTSPPQPCSLFCSSPTSPLAPPPHQLRHSARLRPQQALLRVAQHLFTRPQLHLTPTSAPPAPVRPSPPPALLLSRRPSSPLGTPRPSHRASCAAHRAEEKLQCTRRGNLAPWKRDASWATRAKARASGHLSALAPHAGVHLGLELGAAVVR